MLSNTKRTIKSCRYKIFYSDSIFLRRRRPAIAATTTQRARPATPEPPGIIRPNRPQSSSGSSNRPVLCHQCGTLFSNGNRDCDEFNPSEPSQQDYCKRGEACLWYAELYCVSIYQELEIEIVTFSMRLLACVTFCILQYY